MGIGAKGGGGSIETQVLEITNSEDLMKLRALAKLCSRDFFNDESLLVVVWRRIMEVMETEKNEGGEKDKKEEGAARELEILTLVGSWGRRVVLWGIFRMGGDIISERRKGTRSS